MAKTKRYKENGYVTSEDSNAGMPEAYDEGALERANSSAESQAIADEAKGEGMLKAMRDKAVKPRVSATTTKTTVKATPEKSGYTPMSKEAGEAAQAKFRESSKPDVTKMSLAERMKASRENARSGSRTTDTRSVSERLRSAFGMAKGGSASSRADGIATKGKTRGKIC